MNEPTQRFNALYQDGAVLNWQGGRLALRIERLTDVLLPTGEVVANDPSEQIFTPFVQRVTPGRYEVSIVMIRDEKIGNRPLAARLHIAAGAVETWKLALRPGEDVRTLAPGELFCYGVDAGMGCFMDAQTARQHTSLLDDGDDSYWMSIMDRFYALAELPYWMNHVVNEATGANVVMFSSGWGDGCYPTYEGWSADGRLMCFLTDFGLRDYP